MQTLEKPAAPLGGVANPVAAATKKGQDAAAIDTSSAFARALRGIVAHLRPHKIVETGTYTGLGSTLTLCQALVDNDLPLRDVYSIEVNPGFYAQACENLAARGFAGPGPHLLRGLSVPRALLPTEADIRRETLERVPDASIFIDHQPEMRVHYYQKETHFPDAVDDLLGYVLRNFDHAPDFFLLDSAGHMGFIEFQYTLSLVKAPCHFALDDVYHIKHHRSLQLIMTDPRFTLLDLSREKFGFCLARFDP
jgi:hypothetical protein